MRSKFAVSSLVIAALVFAAGLAYAQTSADKPTMKDKVEQKADQAGDKIKGAAHDAKTGVTDSWVTSKTKIALFGDDRVKGRQVHVETKDGVVVLRGKVDSAEAKTAAGEVAKGVEQSHGNPTDPLIATVERYVGRPYDFSSKSSASFRVIAALEAQ